MRRALDNALALVGVLALVGLGGLGWALAVWLAEGGWVWA